MDGHLTKTRGGKKGRLGRWSGSVFLFSGTGDNRKRKISTVQQIFSRTSSERSRRAADTFVEVPFWEVANRRRGHRALRQEFQELPAHEGTRKRVKD